MCWLAGTVVGFLPLFGWHRGTEPYGKCLFEEVMDYNYLVFLYFATIITPSLLLAAFYAHIYRVIIKQLRQIVTMNPLGGSRNSSRTSSTSLRPPGGTMLRVLGAAQKREVKATQNLSIIVLFFMICWIPLYTINCVKAFCPQCHVNETFTFFCIILSHLNSAVNPLLYAYHLRDFRAALKSCILRMFGIPEPSVPDLHCRPSLASGHQRFQCQREKRLSLQPRIYIDSPVWLRSRAAENSNRVPAISCSLNSIHQTVTGAIGAGDREMWKISEVPSLAEEASRDSAIAKDNISVISKVVDHDLSHSNSSSNISRKLNAMYLGDIYDYDDDDDDVFMPATPSLSRSDLGEPFSTELPFSGCSRHDSVSSLTVQIDNQIISRRSTPQLTDNSDSDSTHLSPRDKLTPIVTPLQKSSNDIMTSPTKHRSLRVVSDFLLQPSIKQYFQNHRNGSATKPTES